MNQIRDRVLAAAIVTSLASTAALSASVTEKDGPAVARVSPARVVTLRHDPRFILKTVAQHMGIALRPEIPAPSVLLESATPLLRVQAAAERQWGFQPRVFVTYYALAGNEIYLINDAAHYEQHDRTMDDSLAHEFVHYLQAKYLGDTFSTDWSESEAVAIQTWFRNAYMAPRLAAAGAQPNTPAE